MNSTIFKRLGILLKILRIRSGLDQGELARRLGVTQPTVSRWESGGGRLADRHVRGWLNTCGGVLSAAQLGTLKLALRGLAEPGAAGSAARSLDALTVELLNRHMPADDALIPYFADVAAGSGECQEQLAGPRRSLAVPREVYERDPGCYALRVVGDSMAPQLLEGDIVIVSPAAALVDGCVVAAYLDPDGDVIKLYRALDGGAVLLQPINPRYPAVMLEPGGEREARIWGRVVLQQREL